MKIAVLSRGPGNYSTKRLLETARARGHEALVVNPAACYVEVDQDNPEVRYKGEDISDLDAIIPRIGPSISRYGSAIVRQFEMKGVYTTAKSIAIERARNKLRSLQLLAKAGLGIPKTVFSRESMDIEDLIDQVGGAPMIIKVARGTHGKGVVLAETRKAAKSVIQAFYVEGVSILLQEYIEEAAGSDIRAFVVGGRVVASMQRQSVDDDFRSNLHQGGTGKKIKLTDEERKAAVKAARAMGLSICGVDIIRSKRGPLVLEVNVSPGFGIEEVTGRDVASKIVDYVEINAKRKPKKDRVGA